MASSRTHRCIDCAHVIEHIPEELCPSCGRCAEHCHQDNHLELERARFKTVGEGEAAHPELIPVKDYADA